MPHECFERERGLDDDDDRITRLSNWHKTTNNVLTSFRLQSVLSVSETAPEIYMELTIQNRLGRALNLTVIPDQHGADRRVGNSETFVATRG